EATSRGKCRLISFGRSEWLPRVESLNRKALNRPRFNPAEAGNESRITLPRACSFSNTHIVQRKEKRHVLICNTPKTSASHAVARRPAFSACAAPASYLSTALSRDAKARPRPSP